MNFATGRHMCKGPFRHAYECEDIVGMVRALYGGRLVFHDGDEELQPGISLHLIGGHTAGIQSVRINTRNGWLVLASDASHYFWGVNNDKLFSIVYSVADMLAGYDKLKKLADGRVEMVIPGHDAEVMKRYPPRARVWKASASGSTEPKGSRVARLVFGMNQSLDGYVDHLSFGPSPALFRHFIEEARGQAGSLYGRPLRADAVLGRGQPDWDAERHAFAAAWRRQPKWVVSRSLKSVGPNATRSSTAILRARSAP